MNAESLFAEALQYSDPAERAAFLDRACGEDAALRQHLEQLLSAHQQASEFLQQPIVGEVNSVSPGQWLDRDATTSPTQSPGTRIGPYKLLQKLGEGGMGVVWMAEKTEPVQRRVALKVIKAGMDSAHVLARFEAERQALALMDHPNIARVLDAGATPEGRPYVVMELVKGIPITKFCDQEQLSPRERLELFVPVCQAVQHAHQKGIIHRDIKPSNVLIALYDGKAVPKVIDFGVAKAMGHKLTERTMFTEVGQIVGTLEYMSPEQAELNNLDIDTRADIYSLGVLLYELLTGSPPFTSRQLRGAAFAEMLRIIREVEPAKPSTKLSSSEELPSIAAKRKLEPKKLTKLVHGELDWITMKCLEKERSRRYETANGLAMDVQRYLADEPVLAGPPSVTYRLRKYMRRHRGSVLASGLVLLALLVGIAGTTAGLLHAEAARRAEEQQRRLAEEERDAKESARKEAETNATEAKRQEGLALEQKRQAEKNAQEAKRQQEIAEEQKRQTEKQAAIARAVNAFLQKDLLGQSDVGQQMLGQRVQRDPDVKVRTLLDRAAQSIAGKFKKQPLTEAAIRLTIGETYQALGRYEEARPHLERSLQLRTAQLGADDPATLTIKNDLALLSYDQAKYDRAETLYKEVLQASTAKLGADHPDTLTYKHNLATLYWVQGKYEKAELLHLEVLHAQTAKLGVDHPSTLTCKNNLAMLYKDQGKYDRAEPLLKEVLQASTAKLGGDHPHTLATKNNLALLYQAQGKYERAEVLFKGVLQAFTAKLGADHPSTLTCKNNLALLYEIQEKYDLAEQLFKEALRGLAAKLGADHPSTLKSKSGLATLYYHQRKYDLVEPLLKEVLQARMAKLGADHPNTLISKNHLALLYQAQKKYDLAEPLFKEVLRDFTTKLGADHPFTLTSMNNLAALYFAQKKFDLVEPLLKESLRARAAKLGADHPDTLNSKFNLARLYQVQGKFDDAEPLFKEVLQVQKAKLGADHPDTISSKFNLAMLYYDQRKYARVEQLFKEVLQANTAKLGANHPDTLTSKNDLARVYQVQRKYDDAETLRKEVLQARTAKLGADHPDTLLSKYNLASLYQVRGKFDNAEPLLREVVDGFRRKFGLAHPSTLRFLGSLIDCRESMGRPNEAEPLRRELANFVKQRTGDDSPAYAAQLALLGHNLLRQKKHADAETILRECLAVREKKQPDLWTTFNTQSLLGAALLGQKKYADAEPLLTQGYEGLKQREKTIPPQAKVRLSEGVERLVQLYDAWGKKDKADEWRKKRDASRKAPPSTPKEKQP